MDDLAPVARDRTLSYLWAVGGGLVLLLFVRDTAVFADGRIADQVVWGRDFINVWTGGKLLNAGHGAMLFDLPAYQHFQQSIFGPLNPHNYSYPPVTYPLAQLLALLPYPVALALWMIATGTLFVYAARPWWPAGAGGAWLAVLTPAALLNIWAGHYGFLVGALFLLGWQNVDRRPVQAGIFFGLMLIKPHLAVLVPLALVMRAKWLTIASAALTAALLFIVSGLIYGWGAWAGFIFKTSAVQAGMIDAGTAFYGLMSTSLMTAALRLSGNWPLAIVGQCLVATAAIGGLALAARRGASTRELALITATATFLLLPYAFAYDLTVVAVAALTVATDPNTGRRARLWAALAFAAPTVGMLTAIVGIPLLPVLLTMLFVAQLQTCSAIGPGWRPRGPDSPSNSTLGAN
ncbi:MAG: glycosyltransferase family 87 protein [Sphingomicrobium sp.]